MINTCPNCKIRKKQKHDNSKWCLHCALQFRKRPKSNMTSEQIKQAKKLIGKMDRREIAQKLDVSLSSLKRAFRGKRLAFYNYCVANPDLVKRVNKYYESHSQSDTAKYFNLSEKQIEHIVYRYKMHKPKQIRWSNDQIVMLAKMAGLVRMDKQAKIFNRPGAKAGSIKSAWTKKFKNCGGSVHGMSEYIAKNLVTDKCPRLKTQFYEARRKGQFYSRKLCLWVDMEKYLKPDIPEFVVDAIKQMAEFQRWLFKTNDPKKEINLMINYK